MSKPAALAEWISHATERVCRTALSIAAFLLVVMLLIVGGQIAMRTATGESFAWSESVAKTLMTWGAFLAAPEALRRGDQLRFTILIEATPRFVQSAARLSVYGLIAATSIAFFFDGVAMVKDGMAIRAAAIDMPVGYFYLVAPTAMAIFVLVCLDGVMRELTGGRASAEDD